MTVAPGSIVAFGSIVARRTNRRRWSGAPGATGATGPSAGTVRAAPARRGACSRTAGAGARRCR